MHASLMKSSRFAAVSTWLLVALVFGAAAARPETPVAAAPAARSLAGFVQPYVDSHALAGAVVLVASKDKVLDLEAVGYADLAAKKPMRTDSYFWIASMTKAYKPTADKTGLEEMPSFPSVDARTGRKMMAFPAGGLFSTATDVSRFCRMILCGGTLDGKCYLSAKAVRQMTSTQTGDLPVPYGFGWATDRKPGGPFGHAGAHKTEMHVFPQYGIVTVFMVQHGDWRNEDEKRIHAKFHEAVIKTFGAAGK